MNTWTTSRRTFTITRPLVMGIVNVTPDSFSDGGRFLATEAAVMHGVHLAEAGADILDVGGESTRPGATPVSADDELRRVVPVIEELARKVSVPLSVDTMKAGVARASLDAGAEIVNDVSGLRDPAVVEIVKATGAAAVVMHMRGTPQTMQDNPVYDDVVAEVATYFEERLRALTGSGIDADRIALDPGIGFGKTTAHNWQLVAHLARFARLGRPVCLGVSRKGFLGKHLGRDVHERLAAGLAVACFGAVAGAVQIVRTHDVAEMRDAMLTLEQVRAHG
jgi:dihydropteroate synthase